MQVNKGSQQGGVARTVTAICVSVAAIGVAVVRIIWPDLGIDAVAVTLLALAALPWLGNIFKSVNTPFGGAEFRDIQSQIQDARKTAESARMTAQMSEESDRARHDAQVHRDQTSVATLAHEYDVTRSNNPPGRSRTDAMTSIVGRMVAAFEAGADVDVNEFMADAMGGRRLAAFVRLYVKPEGSYLLRLVDAFISEAQSFLQYWGLRALSRIVETDPDALDRNTLRRLEDFAEGLHAGSDRRYQINRILDRYRSQTAGSL